MRSKNKPRKRRRKENTAVIFLFALVIITLVSLVIALPAFKISEVEITGTRLLNPESIKKIASVPIGDNLFLTSFGKAKDRIKKIPAVKEVKFRRMIPDRVRIEVIERVESAVSVIGEQSVLIDSDGVIINPQTKEAEPIEIPDISNLPVLIGLRREWFDEKGKLSGKFGESAAKLLVEFKNYMSPKRLEIDLSDVNSIVLFVDDTLKVKIGSVDKIDGKINVFETIFKRLKDQKNDIEYIDVRVPDFPAVKFK
ncbi:MAG: cell division protein FtsQ [Candidatus Saganbacteria bacterium]|uniref:Cell division protein FtsQ n=1 Tax=Candidatus Saganbacteria bacterium TaxID=2575572 RepID=A0A833L1H7_UNCSA|nr:MAG: cell division protein FtsQ [Candidatus Saganbacteria bacterium]